MQSLFFFQKECKYKKHLHLDEVFLKLAVVDLAINLKIYMSKKYKI